MINLAKYPASTVQILGAEKALFRALKTRGNTPKHGLLFHSTYISRAGTKNKGRISRFLANKCSIASRIDCFADKPLDVFGSVLKQQVEDRLVFLDTGTVPKKNLEVMKDAEEQVAQILLEKAEKKKAKSLRKKQKRESKQQSTQDETMEQDENENGIETAEVGEQDGVKKNKKRKRNRSEADEIGTENGVDVGKADGDMSINNDNSLSAKKKKKKKKQSD